MYAYGRRLPRASRLDAVQPDPAGLDGEPGWGWALRRATVCSIAWVSVAHLLTCSAGRPRLIGLGRSNTMMTRAGVL